MLKEVSGLRSRAIGVPPPRVRAGRRATARAVNVAAIAPDSNDVIIPRTKLRVCGGVRIIVGVTRALNASHKKARSPTPA